MLRSYCGGHLRRCAVLGNPHARSVGYSSFIPDFSTSRAYFAISLLKNCSAASGKRSKKQIDADLKAERTW